MKKKTTKKEEAKQKGASFSLHGRTFKGKIIKKTGVNVVVFIERLFFIPKYERYEKRNSKINARVLPDFKDSIKLGDIVEIKECRPISKTIHFVVTKKIKDSNETGNS